ncbi:MAG TPA: hypothetical protein DHW42_08000, partial [Candidatus Marinimicrobia bacterium]|nr:hypothetical protein [Candidatus Neomarinimicrobiota bacterium]
AVEFVRDITEREIIRRELIKEKIFADTLVQTAPVLYVAIGADGKTIMMNDFMLKILGYTKDEITGKDYLTSFVPEDDREMLAGVFNKLTSAHQATLNENRILTKDGSKYLVEWHGKPILNEKGLFQYFFGVGIDITERRKSENELRKYHEHLEELVKERTKELEDKTVTIAKSQEALTYLMEDVNDARQELEIAKSRLEISNRDLEAFAYSVSHDLRAPLRHVDGFAELLMSQSADKLDEKGRSYLDKIITASQNMGTLIDDLLAFSRIGRKEIFKIPVELNSMIEKIKDELESDIKNRKVSWRVDQLGIVRADPTLIKQVFVNLMSNALKYTRPRKEAKIEIGLKKSDENEKIIYIKDNGVGFDMKYSDKLFGVFQRLHSSSDFEGTGIGLANVRRIINRHGGRVWAEAEIDKGAAFYISLPNVGGKVEGEGKG